MAETYYIRLPIYLVNGNSSKTVEISFDNTVISAAEISSVDANSKDNITFSVVKDPGTYEIKIKPLLTGEHPYENVDSNTTICVDDIWISNDNINYYSVLVNYDNVTTNLVDETFGFNPSKGALLWEDCEFTASITLPDSANWNSIYVSNNLSAIASAIQTLTDTPGSDADVLTKIQQKYDLLKARGYS